MSVIRSASYYCYDKYNKPYIRPTSDTKTVSYYTFDGDLITSVPYKDSRDGELQVTQRLDPEAQKPLVYKIQNKKFFHGKEIDKAVEQTYIFFLDKNSNVIGSDTYCSPTSSSSRSPGPKDLEPYTQKYDLSNVPHYVWDESGDVGPIADVEFPTTSGLFKRDDEKVIKTASYYCHDKSGTLFMGYQGGSKNVTFYTADGKQLCIVDNTSDVRDRLDPEAPKPQVSKYKIYYWAGIPLAFGLSYAPTGNFIMFYDNNGTGIGSKRYKGQVPPSPEDVKQYKTSYNLDYAVYDGYDESEREHEKYMSTKGSCTIM